MWVYFQTNSNGTRETEIEKKKKQKTKIIKNLGYQIRKNHLTNRMCRTIKKEKKNHPISPYNITRALKILRGRP